jgi:hemoglobin
MNKDIVGRDEIKLLIDRFYEKIQADPILGPHFAHVNWEKHLPIMVNFWENTLFYTGTYTGNPLRSHQALHQKDPLLPSDFSHWQNLFLATVDELFSGEKAELAKQRALSISTVMQIRLFTNPS